MTTNTETIIKTNSLGLEKIEGLQGIYLPTAKKKQTKITKTKNLSYHLILLTVGTVTFK